MFSSSPGISCGWQTELYGATGQIVVLVSGCLHTLIKTSNIATLQVLVSAHIDKKKKKINAFKQPLEFLVAGKLSCLMVKCLYQVAFEAHCR